jgi:hypothetical protein
MERARLFVLANARVLDRHYYAWRFEGGSAEPVVRALLAYQNDDGGFGNALEPDLRGAASQPVPAEYALHLLDEVDRFDGRIVGPVCRWLTSASTSEAGVPFVLASVGDGSHAPWWQPTGRASLNPTAGIVGVLHKRGVRHAWVDPATNYCWAALSDHLDEVEPDDAISVLRFLEHVPDRARAVETFVPLGQRIVETLVAIDPDMPGYVKNPLDFAPHPDSLARQLFGNDLIEAHLAALVRRQQPDGGWPITWDPPSPAAAWEWRAQRTIKALDVLDRYRQLPT